MVVPTEAISSRAVFLVAFTLAARILKRPTAASLFAAFTTSEWRDAMIGAVFVVCRGFHDDRDGM